MNNVKPNQRSFEPLNLEFVSDLELGISDLRGIVNLECVGSAGLQSPRFGSDAAHFGSKVADFGIKTACFCHRLATQIRPKTPFSPVKTQFPS